MFDRTNADFSGILKKPKINNGTTTAAAAVPQQIYVSEVRHKVHIEVNEKGTVAAAATESKINLIHFSIYLDRLDNFNFGIRNNLSF